MVSYIGGIFMTENIRRFTFRIPLELFNGIESIAKQNHRSVNSEIIIAIENYLQKHQCNDTKQTKSTSE